MNILNLFKQATFCLVLGAGITTATFADDAEQSRSDGKGEIESKAQTDAQADVETDAEEHQATPAPMDNARLGALLLQLDPKLGGGAGNWMLTFDDVSAQVLTDQAADRMRIMIPITDAKSLEAEVLYRILQANFESALDARYAIAQGLVWATFIHPLSPLSEGELVLALAQTFNAAATFGTSYSGGLFQFGGGDNRNEIFDSIIERGTPL